MVAEMVIASTFSMSLMSMTEIHLCVPFSKNNNLGKKKKKKQKNGIMESSATQHCLERVGKECFNFPALKAGKRAQKPF